MCVCLFSVLDWKFHCYSQINNVLRIMGINTKIFSLARSICLIVYQLLIGYLILKFNLVCVEWGESVHWYGQHQQWQTSQLWLIFVSASHQTGLDTRSNDPKVDYSGDIGEEKVENEQRLVPCLTMLVISPLSEIWVWWA